MKPAHCDPTLNTDCAVLSTKFTEAGWTPSEQNFRERQFVIWNGSFYSVAGKPPYGSPCSKSCQTAEEVLAFLEAKTAGATSSKAIDTPIIAIAIPAQSVATDRPKADSDEIARLRARIAELESRPPEVREVEKIVERVVEVPAPVVVEEATEPYTPDFTLIPDALAKFAEADETATDFRNRLKRLWQRFGIADGEHFPGGGEPLTGEEKITMREIDIVLNSDEGRNAGLLQWLQADEQNT